MSDRPSKNDFGAEVLLQEYLRLCSDIRSIESTGDRVVSIAVTLLTLGATVGIVQKIGPIFIVMPVAIVGVLMYGLTLYVWIFSMGGYKKHVEDLINSKSKETILLWERLVPKRDKYNLARSVLISIYVLVAGCVMALSVIQVSKYYGLWVGRSIAGVSIIGLLMLIFAWKIMKRVGSSTYSAALELYRATPNYVEPLREVKTETRSDLI